MKLSTNGYIELASYEGVAKSPYLDSVGVKTWSVGLTKSDIPDLASWPWDQEQNLDYCFEEFKNKVQKYVDGVNSALKVAQLQFQFDALVSITYNIGIAGMTNSTFMRDINNGGNENAIVAAWKAWDRGGGRVIQGLENRRERECNLYVNGMYSNNGSIQLITVNPATHREEGGKDIPVSQYF